jgi:hypothetical protein
MAAESKMIAIVKTWVSGNFPASSLPAKNAE